MKTRAILAILLASIAVPGAPLAVAADLGTLPICTGATDQFFLRTQGVLSSATWEVTSSPAGLIQFSLSPDGPFADTIRFTVFYGNTGGEVTTFFIRGLQSGTTQFVATPDEFVQGREVLTATMLVDRIAGVTLVDTNDDLLDDNPLAGGGKRKIADLDVSQVDQFAPVPLSGPFDDARKVRARITLEGQTQGFPVHVGVFDVDDPSDNAVVDPNGTQGDDNLGTNGGPRRLRGTSEQDGIARVDAQLSTQPGDNFRLAVVCDAELLDNLAVDGTDVVRSTGEPLAAVDGRISDMVTVWRRLHLEVDTMGPVQCNQLFGRIASMRAAAGGRTQVKLADVTDSCGVAFSLKGKATKADEFVNGALRVQGSDFDVIISKGDVITVSGALPASALGTQARLVDDDSVAGGPRDGDEGDPVPPPDLALLQDSSDPAQNVLAAAYIITLHDLPPGAMPDMVVNLPQNDREDQRPFYRYDWIAHDNDPNFWTGYLLGAYQGESRRDNDPISETNTGLFLGLTDLSNTGSLVYAETIRDGAPTPPVPECGPAEIAAHEVVHLFDPGEIHLPNGSGLMSETCGQGTQLNAQSLRIIREALRP